MDSVRGGEITVEELINELGNYNPNDLVVVDGYESNYETPIVMAVKVQEKPNLDNEYWKGCWDDEGTRDAIRIGRITS